jgi:hypothetical protein
MAARTRFGLLEDIEAIQPELESALVKQREARVFEDRPRPTDVEAVVFFGRHAIDESKPDERVENQVDHRMGHRHDQSTARGKDPFAFGSQRGGILDVFEYGEESDAVEDVVVETMVSGKVPAKDLDGLVARWGGDRVNADCRPDPRQREIDQAPVVAADVEEPIAGTYEGEGLSDSPSLQQAIQPLHVEGPDPRRRIPSML